MKEFPVFMKNPANAVCSDQQSKGVEGYVFDGTDGSQMAIWECKLSGTSLEHTHDFDEYLIIVDGKYTLIIKDQKYILKAGDEFYIPKGTPHSGEFEERTRTIHAFGGQRAKREIKD